WQLHRARPASLRRSAGASPLRACTDLPSCACRPKEPSMPSQSADRSLSHTAAVVPAPGNELTAARPVLPGRSAAENGDDLTTMAARNSPATADGADDATGNAPSVSGAYIYGYDAAGNPTLTDAG